MTRAIQQFHPSLSPGDAVSNPVFAMRRLFRAVVPGDLLVLDFSIADCGVSQYAGSARRQDHVDGHV